MHTKYMSKKMDSYGVGKQQSRQKEMHVRINEAFGSKFAISAISIRQREQHTRISPFRMPSFKDTFNRRGLKVIQNCRGG